MTVKEFKYMEENIMTVKELQDFLSYCDPDASIIVTNGDNSHIVETIDVDYVVSKKVLRIDVS